MKKAEGKISFIHHDKNRAVVEYLDNNRKKTIQASLDIITAGENKKGKQTHRFLIGDQVSFTIKKTGANGSIQYAENLTYLYNTALELLINRARLNNKLLGYIKITDDKYFIKEIESYLFFPLSLSVYEIPPDEKETDQPVYFKLDNLDKPDKLTAVLYNHEYIPEYHKAIQHFKKQSLVQARVYNITKFGIYVYLVGDTLQAKLPIDELLQKKIDDKSIAVNSVIPVKIKHLTATRIVVEPVE